MKEHFRASLDREAFCCHAAGTRRRGYFFGPFFWFIRCCHKLLISFLHKFHSAPNTLDTVSLGLFSMPPAIYFYIVATRIVCSSVWWNLYFKAPPRPLLIPPECVIASILTQFIVLNSLVAFGGSFAFSLLPSVCFFLPPSAQTRDVGWRIVM